MKRWQFDMIVFIAFTLGAVALIAVATLIILGILAAIF